MDAELIRGRLASDHDVDAVSGEAESARTAGIEGVPCFILGGVFAVSGAQAPEALAGAIEHAAVERDHSAAAAAAEMGAT